MPLPKDPKKREEFLERLRGLQLGRKASKKTKKLMSLKRKGVPKSEETKERMRHPHKINIKKDLKPSFKNKYLNNNRFKTTDGYIRVRKKTHPQAQNNFILEHRLVMEKHLGRYLTQKEEVHHENEIKEDNRIENLRLFKTKADHTRYHQKLKRK